MRAGQAVLQFDWSKACLSMDLPVFVYSHMKTSLNSVSSFKTEKMFEAASYVVTDLPCDAKKVLLFDQG